jgi:hypothetical protein
MYVGFSSNDNKRLPRSILDNFFSEDGLRFKFSYNSNCFSKDDSRLFLRNYSNEGSEKIPEDIMNTLSSQFHEILESFSGDKYEVSDPCEISEIALGQLLAGYNSVTNTVSGCYKLLREFSGSYDGATRRYEVVFDCIPMATAIDITNNKRYIAIDEKQFGKIIYNEGTFKNSKSTDKETGEYKGFQNLKPSKIISSLKPIRKVGYRNDWGDTVWMGSVDKVKVSSTGDKACFTGVQRFHEEIIESLKPFSEEILISSDPAEIYSLSTADSDCGTLGTSCMRSENRSQYTCAKSTDFFKHIPFLKIAYILNKEGKLKARALMWENVTDNDSGKKFTFIDRIYGTDKSVIGMKEWAHSNGYYCKVNQSYGDPTLYGANEDRIKNYSSLPTKLGSSAYSNSTPYFDTMKYLYHEDSSKDHITVTFNSLKNEYRRDRRDFVTVNHTGEYIIAKKCACCGNVTLVSVVVNAYDEDKNEDRHACNSCSYDYHNRKYIKNKKTKSVDIFDKSISPKGLVPKSELGNVVNVKIKGNDYSMLLNTMDNDQLLKVIREIYKKSGTSNSLEKLERVASIINENM